MRTPVPVLNEDMSSPQLMETARARLSFFSRRCPDSADINEDCALIFPHPDGIVLAVADGTGGGPDGEKASRLTIEALNEVLSGPQESLRDAILDGFELANERVIALGTGAGTTLSVVEIQESKEGSQLRSYHAGDSSLLVTGGRGKIKLTTIPHSPVGYGVEAGLITPTDALHHDDLHIVSNLVGVADMRVEMGSAQTLSTRDTVILGTDGLFDNFQSSELIESTRRGPLHKAAERLVAESTARMTHPTKGNPSKPDDLTFVLYRRTAPKSK